MADRRHAADGETGRLAHEVGVRAGDRLADRRRDLRLIDAIDAGRDDENRAIAAGAAEHERLADLRHRAADCCRGVGGGAGRRFELHDQVPVAERRLDPERGRSCRGLHGHGRSQVIIFFYPQMD